MRSVRDLVARGDGVSASLIESVPMSQPAFDFGDDELDDGANPTYTVGELADAINSSFQRSFGDGIWVRGEITGWSDRGNHAYFSLADDASSASATARHQRAVLRAGSHAPATDAAEAPAATGRRHEGPGVRLPRLLRAHRSHRPEDDRHRPEVHARRHRPVARRDRPSPGRRGAARPRTVVVRCRRCRCGSAPSPASAPPPGTTSATNSNRAALGFQLSVVDVRVQGEFAVGPWSPRRSARSAGVGHLDAIVVIRGGGAKNELAVFDAEVDRPHHRREPGTGAHRARVTRSTAAWPTRSRTPRSKTPTACAGELDRPRRRISGRHRRPRGTAIVRRADASAGHVDQRAVRPRPIASPAALMRRSNGPTNGCRCASIGSARVGPAALATARRRLDRRGGRPPGRAIRAGAQRASEPARRRRRPGRRRSTRRSSSPAAGRSPAGRRRHRPLGRRRRAGRRTHHLRHRRFDHEHRPRTVHVRPKEPPA